MNEQDQINIVAALIWALVHARKATEIEPKEARALALVALKAVQEEDEAHVVKGATC